MAVQDGKLAAAAIHAQLVLQATEKS